MEMGCSRRACRDKLGVTSWDETAATRVDGQSADRQPGRQRATRRSVPGGRRGYTLGSSDKSGAEDRGLNSRRAGYGWLSATRSLMSLRWRFKCRHPTTLLFLRAWPVRCCKSDVATSRILHITDEKCALRMSDRYDARCVGWDEIGDQKSGGHCGGLNGAAQFSAKMGDRARTHQTLGLRHRTQADTLITWSRCERRAARTRSQSPGGCWACE